MLSKTQSIISVCFCAGEKIGSGNFGLVHKGSLTSRYITLNAVGKPIAIKVPKQDLEVEVFKNVLREVKIMAHVGSHENVVCFIGACTENIRRRIATLKQIV